MNSILKVIETDISVSIFTFVKRVTSIKYASVKNSASAQNDNDATILGVRPADYFVSIGR